jgi:pyruvate dehydrogenase E2 component (dihydrolipoamide acetyltransferase)
MAEQKIIVPNIGDFKEVEVIEVLVKEGQEIKKDDSVITLESDKSSVEVPSNFSGIIKKINIKIGDKISEGTTILSLESEENNKEKAQSTSENKNNNIEKNEIIDFPKNNKKNNALLTSQVVEGKIKSASPNVRKFTRELGADISKISGSERRKKLYKKSVNKYSSYRCSSYRYSKQNK